MAKDPQWGDPNSLGLATIRDADVVDPTPINNNFKKIESRLANDYVLQTETTDYWWYTLFNSGVCLFGMDDYNMGNIRINVPWGGAVSSATLSLPGKFPMPWGSPGYFYFDIKIVNYDAMFLDVQAWRFFNVSIDPRDFHQSTGTLTPPKWCIYWWPESSKYNDITLTDVKVTAFGDGFILDV